MKAVKTIAAPAQKRVPSNPAFLPVPFARNRLLFRKRQDNGQELVCRGLLLVLLPGLLSAYVVQALAVRRKQTEVDKIVEALIFSLILYLVTLPFFGYTLPVSWHETASQSNTFLISVRWEQLCALSIASLLLGILYATSINRDWALGLFRWMRITERTARSTIWNDVFQQVGGWVQVGLADQVVVTGWLRYYSDEAEESSLFIEQAAWITKEGKEAPIQGPGILITKDLGIEYVIFLNSREDAVGQARPAGLEPESEA